IGASGSLVFEDAAAGARSDTLIINGTAASDVFNVGTDGGDTLQVLKSDGFVFTTVIISTPRISQLTLNGLDGDDTFNVVAPLNYTSTIIDAGNPSASDLVNLTGATGL